jgi:hypothetical protein
MEGWLMWESMTGSRARLIVCGLAVAAVAGVVASITGPVSAQTDGRVCADATLRGDYGFLISGFKPVPPPLGGGLERFNAVGIYAFDGNGTFTVEGGALQGEVTGLNPDPPNPVGAYELEPNCTGTMSWQPNLNVPVVLRFAIVVVDNARQIKLAGSTGISQGEAVRK